MFASERLRLTLGGGCVLLAAVMFVAFVSHLFVWQNDQNLVADLPAFDFLFDKNLAAQNLLGRLGALISHLFIYGTFGMGAFAFPYILGLLGTRILGYNFNISYKKHYQNAAILMLSVSFTLGFLLSSWNIWGGMFGYFVGSWLSGFLGNFGTFLVLMFVWFGVIRIYFGVIFNFDGILEGFRSEKTNASTKKNTTPRSMPVPIAPEEPTTRIDINQPLELYQPSPEPYLAPTDNVRPTEITPPVEITPPAPTDQFEIIKPQAAQPKLPLPNPNLELELTPPPAADPTTPPQATIANPNALLPYDPTLELSQYQYPTISLLDPPPINNNVKYDEEELRNYKNQIVETLRQFGIEIDRIRATVGPTVTLYEIVPAAGVRISKIKNLEDDIALNLAALGIRIIAPMPGKGTIGIEVPNHHKEIVSIATVFGSEKFLKNDYALPIALGKTISNEVFVTDLARMPHLLMAGATGQGKSVGLNVILASLLYKKHPSQIKFVLVDPKKVELDIFKTIERHFLAKLPNEEEAIITDTAKVVNTLNSLCMEMDARYDLLKDASVRNIAEYNLKFINRQLNPEKGHQFMPYIILVVDEFADLMMTAGKEVEQPITRLAQLARAVGIHLIIATQRPSTNIITGTIKANFPARIAFKVASYIDSRTILDSKGAEQLVGQGDMLLAQGSEIVRLQCAFVSTDEIGRVTSFIGEQQGYSSAFMLPEFVGKDAPNGAKSIDELADRDTMLADAARTLVANQQGSTSLIQRKLKLGYARSGRIMDQLEAMGVVGKFEGSRPREVMFNDLASLEVFLKQNGL
jgi:S-DNA-T family DNA segregation ATPase FtsK/SpoIIIE